MKLFDGGVILIISIVVFAAVIGVISSKYLGDDNALEEATEAVIEKETGLDIDLTPTSKEKK